MGISHKDRQYMRMALDLAVKARGCTSPNPMVGAVLVRDDEVIGQGYHQKAGMPHAEIEALRDANQSAEDATLYINLEPCCHQGKTPPCVDAVIEAGITRVVCAMVDPNPLVSGRGLQELRQAGIEVDCKCLESEARRLNEAFIIYHMRKRPFVIAKWAMTLDGRTSTSTGDSRWISNEKSREYSHFIRAGVDAIGVGLGTVFFDNPKLNVRLQGYEREQPRRVIFDGRLRTPLGAKCLECGGGETILLTCESAPVDRLERMRASGHKVLIIPGPGRMIDVGVAFEALGNEGIQSILIEGGRQLHTSLLRANLVDKLVVFVGPRLVGGSEQTSPLDDLGISLMKKAVSLRNAEVKAFGTDACLEGYVNSIPRPKVS